MSSPVFLAENFYNTHQFVDHTVDAEEEPSGYEAWRVATGRRSGLQYWTPSTANSDTYVDATCDRTRTANMLILDRGHNLAGYDIELRASQDDFTTYETILDITVPSVSTPGALTDGVLTEEGAYVKQFDARSYTYWRVFVNAMGAGLQPQIVGLWLGLAWSPDYLEMPSAKDADDLIVEETVSESGWVGRGPATQRRSDTIKLKLSSYDEYDEARYHIQGLFGAGYPMWIFHHDDQADQGLCAIRQSGSHLGFARQADWGYEQVQFSYIEHEPKTR